MMGYIASFILGGVTVLAMVGFGKFEHGVERDEKVLELEKQAAQLKSAAGASVYELIDMFRAGWILIPPHREEDDPE